MKRILILLLIIVCISAQTEADIFFNDGGVHNIDYAIYDYVLVDWGTPEMYTTVNLLPGGSISDGLIAHESSRINISGGTVGFLDIVDSCQAVISDGTILTDMHASGSCQVDISGGSILEEMWINDSQVDISGGSIGSYLFTRGSGQVNISGGTIGNELQSFGESIVTIYGSDFAVDGVPFGYGELTDNGGSYEDPHRLLTGTLTSSELINNAFYIGDDAKIVLVHDPYVPIPVPVPGAVILGSLGLTFSGCLLCRRKIL